MVSLSIRVPEEPLQAFESGSRFLQLEVGHDYLSVVLWNIEQRRPESCEVFNGIADWEEEWPWMRQQSRLLDMRGVSARLVSACERTLPLPAILFQPDAARQQIETLYGAGGYWHSGADVLPEQGMVIAWQMPQQPYQLISEHFEVLQANSLAGLMVENGLYHRQDEGHHGALVFVPRGCWIALWKAGKLMLCRHFRLDAPDDLSYHLLNLCHQWDVDTETVHWEASGMCEADAPLWQAAERFFKHIDWARTNYAIGEGVPPHYFTHLLRHLS